MMTTPYPSDGIEMKICKKCKADKPKSEFYKYKAGAGGLFGKCKECIKYAVRKSRRNNSSHYAQYEKRRYKEDQDRIKMLRNRADQWRRDNPHRYKALTAVGNALRDGKLKKENCIFCNSKCNLQAHHKDFSKPLDVIWLCTKCHHRLRINFPEKIEAAQCL